MFWTRFKKEDTQKTRVLKLLQSRCEINAWDLSYKAKVLHYTNVIKMLREDWHIIENRMEYKNKIRYSFYKLIKQ